MIIINVLQPERHFIITNNIFLRPKQNLFKRKTYLRGKFLFYYYAVEVRIIFKSLLVCVFVCTNKTHKGTYSTNSYRIYYECYSLKDLVITTKKNSGTTRLNQTVHEIRFNFFYDFMH